MRKTIDHVNQKAVIGGTAKSTDEPTAEAVFEAIHAVMHRYRALQYRAQRDAALALSHMDGKVLGYFARHPDATQKQLATHSGRDKGQLARLVAGLRAQGLLEAGVDAADRRNIPLRLTAEGRLALQALQRQARRVAAQAVTGLDAEARHQLVQLLHTVAGNLGEAPAGT